MTKALETVIKSLSLATTDQYLPPHFLFLRAMSYFHATYYFVHNFCTISISLSVYQWYILIGKW